jgi:hypothetical protein
MLLICLTHVPCLFAVEKSIIKHIQIVVLWAVSNTLKFYMWIPMFQRNMMPPSSGSKWTQWVYGRMYRHCDMETDYSEPWDEMEGGKKSQVLDNRCCKTELHCRNGRVTWKQLVFKLGIWLTSPHKNMVRTHMESTVITLFYCCISKRREW